MSGDYTFEMYEQFVAEEKARQPHWRLGQTCFNVLYKTRYDLSEQIRGGGVDPFHRDSVIPEFLTWVQEHWLPEVPG